jgi:hypothetical protein
VYQTDLIKLFAIDGIGKGYNTTRYHLFHRVDQMELEDRITEEHREFRKMLVLLNDTGAEDVDERLEVYADLMMRVDAHEKAEERTLYTEMKKDDDLKELALESIEEHRVSRILMVELRNVGLDDELWLPKIRMISSLLEAHMNKEEELVLPAATEALEEAVMKDITTRYGELQKQILVQATSGPPPF